MPAGLADRFEQKFPQLTRKPAQLTAVERAQLVGPIDFFQKLVHASELTHDDEISKLSEPASATAKLGERVDRVVAQLARENLGALQTDCTYVGGFVAARVCVAFRARSAP